MSDYRAIAGVSATIQSLLRDRIELPTGVTLAQLQVTVANPKVELIGEVEPPRVNLFLYRVTENAHLKNQEIPGRGNPGEFGRPPLSLNLHYMLTAYGTTAQAGDTPNEERAHALFGSAMRVLHDFPVITDALLTVRAPAGQPILESSLANEFETITITLEPTGLEELSRVWTALTLSYRLSVSYLVTVIQIESRRPRRTALPVKARRVHVATLARPRITAVYRTPAPGEAVGDARIAVLQQLSIEGENFRATRTLVRLGELEAVVVTPVSDELIHVTIPDAVAAPQAPLMPGALQVQVLTERPGEAVEGALDNGVLVASMRTESSNPSSFVLAPSMSGSAPASGPAGTALTITGTRLFGPGIVSSVIIGSMTVPVAAPATPTSIQVNVPALPPSPTPYRIVVVANGVPSVEERTFQVV